MNPQNQGDILSMVAAQAHFWKKTAMSKSAILGIVAVSFLLTMIPEPFVEPSTGEDDPTLRLNKKQRAALLAEIAARQVGRRACPVCGLANAVEQAICLRCGAALRDPNMTEPAVLIAHALTPAPEATRQAILTDQTSIFLEIGTNLINLPNAKILTIGRRSLTSDALQPHVDLTPYQAWNAGVSRRHIQIRRKGTFAYVMDLGSSNGALLNGHRLEPNTERLLRNHDDLQLCRLSIRVRFETKEALQDANHQASREHKTTLEDPLGSG